LTAGEGSPGGGERVAYSRAVEAPASRGRAILRFLAHRGLRALTLAQEWAMRAAGAVGPRPRPLPPEGADVLVTGTFYAENWLAAHLRPLAQSRGCRRLVVVTQFPVPAFDKTVWVPPPALLRRVVGGTPARLLTFAWLAFTRRPHVLGGFHLLLNGLIAQVLARLCGARSIYFCGGGPTEVLDGGVWSENRLFRRMETPDEVVERRLLAAVGRFDHVVTMGRRAADFFRSRGVDTDFRVISGGIDAAQFAPATAPPAADVVFVARLSRVKRVDLLLRALALVVRVRPETTALIVGDGPLLEELKADAIALGLGGKVSFVGHQKDVESWLRQGRVFVLTSDSEGLSLALMEAMLCGLPAVVSDVGDLPELVEHGVNGYLVAERTPEAFAGPLAELLGDADRLERFSRAARAAALRYDVAETALRWDELFLAS
jgi:L-malate glycosyltransferase